MNCRLNLLFAIIAVSTTSFAETPVESELINERECNQWKMKVGELDFFCIEDHSREIDMKGFDESDHAELKNLMPEGKSSGSNILFVIKKGEKAVLIDSGIYGKLPKSLKTIGLLPEDIDAVLLTHIHLSPIGGLIRGDRPVFPNASLWLSIQDAEDFKKKWKGEGRFFDKCEKAYKGIKYINQDEMTPLVMDEVTAMGLPGHTPGHTGFMIRSGQERLLVIGDMIFCADAQFKRPDINMRTDENKDMAKETRRKVLALAAEEKLIIAGSRLPFPGVGRVEIDGDGFRFIPLPAHEGEAIPNPL